MEKPIILRAAKLPDTTIATLNSLFTVLDLPASPQDIPPFLAQHGSQIQGMALRKTIVDQTFLNALPNLSIIASYSAGLDNVDVAAVRARGIVLENTSSILAEDVANTALGLALALTRDLVRADHFVRSDQWPGQPQYPLGRSLSQMDVGIVGLGTIGQAVARRMECLGARVHYQGPHRKDVPYTFHLTARELAAACEMVILTCPLTPTTRHLVDHDVLTALGPRGYLINIARGPVVDEKALIAALADHHIAGAALDVFEHEPHVPDALKTNPRVILTPHIGSATEETRQAMADHVVTVLADHFSVARPDQMPPQTR